MDAVSATHPCRWDLSPLAKRVFASASPAELPVPAPPPHICIWEEGHHVPPMGKERGFVFRLLGAQQLRKSLGVLHGRFVCPPHLLSSADTCIRMDSRVFILYFRL